MMKKKAGGKCRQERDDILKEMIRDKTTTTKRADKQEKEMKKLLR